MLFLGIYYPNCRWQLSHVANTVKVLVKLLALTAEYEEFLLREYLIICTLKCFQFFEALNALVHSWEVGEHSTKPTFSH